MKIKTNVRAGLSTNPPAVSRCVGAGGGGGARPCPTCPFP
jgi:hypothetical protein